MLVVGGIGVSDPEELLLAWLNIWLRSGLMNDGTERVAARVDAIFPLWMTYTVQKSGTDFKTVPGMSFTLNLYVQNATWFRQL